MGTLNIRRLVSVAPGRLARTEHQAAIDLDAALKRVAHGDQEAFTGLYDALGSSVYGLARRVIRDEHRAQDVSQEVFIQVWRLARRFDPARGSAKNWILTIAHRRAVDAVRHDQAARNRDAKHLSCDGPARNVVEEAAEASERRAEVRACMNTLSPLQKQALTMAYYDGHTYAEVARLLGANLSAVKTRMRDGMVRLRDCMDSASARRRSGRGSSRRARTS